MPFVNIKRLHPDAVIPQYKTEGASGADLVSVQNIVIHAGDVEVVDVGFSIELPRGYEMQIRPRSGLAAKHAVTVLNAPGTIDSDYRGPIKVILINHSNKGYSVNVGDRIAQMVLQKTHEAFFVDKYMLESTERGEGGLGSTGKD
jgi:dUTP pyrophosphatase